MEKFAKFDVPEAVLTDFIAEVVDKGFTANTGKQKRNGDYVVTVAYDKDQEEDIDTLDEYLNQLIDDMTEEEEEEEEEEQDEDDQ